jgi:hypothetical protein
VCTPGLCADGDALYAVVETPHGKKIISLKATTLIAGEQETIEKGGELVLLYIESRRIAGP